MDGELDQQGPAQLAPGSDSMEPRRIPRRTERAIKDGEQAELEAGGLSGGGGEQQ